MQSFDSLHEEQEFPKILPGNSHLQVNLTRELVRSISYLTQTRTRTYFFQSYPPPEASLKDFFGMFGPKKQNGLKTVIRLEDVATVSHDNRLIFLNSFVHLTQL